MQSRKQLERAFLLLNLVLMTTFVGIRDGYSQFYTEDFGDDMSNACASQGELASDYGSWNVTDVTTNGGLANVWYVSATEGGGHDPAANPCGDQCIVNTAGVTDQTLHIGKLSLPAADVGATYNGLNQTFGIYNTDRRTESPPIDVAGVYNITLDFWYAASANNIDKASVEIFDGTSWINVGDLPSTGNCSPGFLNWEAFSVLLPASANDITNLQIGFRWVNNSDGIVEESSVAIDNIRLTAGAPPVVPVADFEVLDGNDTFCEGSCTTLNDLTNFDPLSSGAANATYAWTFTGGNPATSSDQNPVVCYDTPGDYDVTLTVTDNIGPSDPVTKTGLIHVTDCGPEIAISASNLTPCSTEDCIDFTDESTTANPNGITAWLWTFTSPTGVETTSALQNPTNICLNEIGFYDVTLAATDPDRTEEQTFTDFIEVLDCSGPNIAFEADRTVICPGSCIQLTDMSTSNGTITAWNWDLPGGQAVGEDMPGVSTQQNPVVCYQAPGSYTITLSATDQEGPSAIPDSITITVDPCTGPPEAAFVASDTLICTGDCVDFSNQSLGLSESYSWIFQGADQPTSMEENPSPICYSDSGYYDVTLVVSNSNGETSPLTLHNYIHVAQCISPPTPRIEVTADTICAGTCVDYTSVSTGIGISAWEWNFQGTVDGSGMSTDENPTQICYDNPGSYAVSLKVTGAGGDSLRVFQDAVTVVSTPECRPSVEVSTPDTLCVGDCANFTAQFMNADSVQWTFQGGTPATSNAENPGIVCFNTQGEYMIIVEAWNAAGASQPTVLNLFVGEKPPLNAGPDKSINSGAEVTLKGTIAGDNAPEGDFLWQPFDLVDDFTSQTVHTTPDETTQYIVYYHEPGTCTAIDTVSVFVNFVAAVGVPTAFSPNGDGENDVLKVLGQGITRMKFKVFNRYGQLVFESDRQDNGWDGTQNGKELNPGTFVYTLEVSFAEGNLEVYKGNVTLFK